MPLFLVAIDRPGHHLVLRKRDVKAVQVACPMIEIRYLCEDGSPKFIVPKLPIRIDFLAPLPGMIGGRHVS